VRFPDESAAQLSSEREGPAPRLGNPRAGAIDQSCRRGTWSAPPRPTARLEIDAVALGRRGQFFEHLRVSPGGRLNHDPATRLLRTDGNLPINGQRATDVHIGRHLQFERCERELKTIGNDSSGRIGARGKRGADQVTWVGPS
jgi:hypothetical protein